MKKKSYNSLSGLQKLKKEISKSENDDLINELKELWKITEASLIGQVIVNPKKEGSFLFVNIETTNRERVKYPNNKDVVLIIPKNLEVKPMKKYKFSFKISPSKYRTQLKQPHHIIVDHLKDVKVLDDFYSKEGKSFINNLIKKDEEDYLRNSSIAGKLSRSLDSLLNEINKKPETFVFELIQNADDYPNANKDNTELKFTITKDHLVFSHNGMEFSKENVIAISDIGSDDKKNKEDKIGFKGMGFKSIFKFSNHVWIKSGIFSFKFDENYYGRKELINGEKNPNYCSHSMPWQVLPIWTAPPLYYLEKKEQNLLKSPVCIFIRPNGLSTVDRIEKLLDIEKMFLKTFKNEDRIFLFLRNVKKLEFSGKKSNFTTILNREKWSVSKLKKLDIPTEIRERINLQSESEVRIPKKYGTISATEITFATKRDNTEIQKTDDAKIFAYLPTNWNLGFNFLVNGNFIPDGSREELFEDIEWNLYLMQEAGRLFVQWISDMITELDNSSPYKILPDLDNIIRNEKNDKKLKFLEQFKVGMQNGILETPFVLDINKKLCLLNDIIIDKTGFSEVLGETIFKQAFNIDKNILQKEIKNKSWFDNQLSGTQVEIFDWDTLKENSAELTSILKDPITNVKFINFLISSEKIYDFKDIAFVLTKTGDLEKPSNVYINITDEDLSFVSKLDVHQMNAEVKSGIIGEYKNYFIEYDGYKFIQDEIISKTDFVNGIIKTIEVSKELINYLLKFDLSFNPKDRMRLRDIHIYNQNLELCQVDNIYIFSHNLKDLIDNQCLSKDHYSIASDKYSDVENKFLNSIGVKPVNQVEFIKNQICTSINMINDHIEQLDDNLKLEATQGLIELIMNSSEGFSEIDANSIFSACKNLKILTTENDLVSLKECYLSYEYTGNRDIENLMEGFSEKSFSFVSPSYLSLSKYDKKEWKKTLKLLRCSDDHLSFVKNELLNMLDELNENQIVNATKLIFKYHNKLEKELISLNYFPVLTKSGIVNICEDQVYLGKEYYQGLDSEIENLIENCLSDYSISNKYTINKYEEWKKFWLLIGDFSEQENDEIIEDCFKYLNDNEFAIDIQLDSILNWMKAHPNLSEGHLPTYIHKNLVTPNLNEELCYSSQLFDNSLKDIVKDNERVCSIDLSDYPTIQESLGLRLILDFETCIKILERKESLTWLNENKIINRIYTLLTEEHECFSEDFIVNGRVMNQEKEWVLISDLFSIEEVFSEKLGVKKCKHIIHKDFNKLSSELKVVELTEEDFEFNPIGAEQNIQLKNTLLDRMKYISFIKDQDLYGEIEDNLKEKIKPISLKKCKKISLQFEEIKKNDFSFWADEDQSILYYIGNWKEFSAAKMFEWIFQYLELSGDGIRRAFERILLAHDHLEIIEYLKENGFNKIPKEWEIEEEVKVKEVDVVEEEIEEVKNTEVFQVNYSESEIAYLESVITGEIDFGESDQFDINRNAIFRSILFLRDEGYIILESTLESFMDNNEKQFKHENGDVSCFIIRSAVKGVLFLDPSSWEKLDREDISLLIYQGGEEIIRINSKESLIKDYTDFNKFGLVRVGDNFDFDVNDFDNLLFERDDAFVNEKYDKYKLLFLLNENEHTHTFIDIFKSIGGENDSK
mgnify:CR=1 FL=1|tara:strand:+ start:4118 stop:8977 length:4860 start_codon:yes stop_codon:yes gene_type:complete